MSSIDLTLNLSKLPTFLQDKAFTSKHMEVTHLGGSAVHQFATSFLLMDPEINLVRHLARGIDRLNP
jgi:hypothetical protein